MEVLIQALDTKLTGDFLIKITDACKRSAGVFTSLMALFWCTLAAGIGISQGIVSLFSLAHDPPALKAEAEDLGNRGGLLNVEDSESAQGWGRLLYQE